MRPTDARLCRYGRRRRWDLTGRRESWVSLCVAHAYLPAREALRWLMRPRAAIPPPNFRRNMGVKARIGGIAGLRMGRHLTLMMLVMVVMLVGAPAALACTPQEYMSDEELASGPYDTSPSPWESASHSTGHGASASMTAREKAKPAPSASLGADGPSGLSLILLAVMGATAIAIRALSSSVEATRPPAGAVDEIETEFQELLQSARVGSC